MFYNNALYKFKIPDEAPMSLAGSVLNASAMSAGQFMRRDFRKYPYLQHRVFDPQLYLSSLDPNVARSTVANLATWPWFGASGVPQYESSRHGTLKNWEENFEGQLIASWRGVAPQDLTEIRRTVYECVQRQIAIGCEAIIIPSPMTTIAASSYELEGAYLDAGIEACQTLQVNVPTFGTIALSDNLIRGVPPNQHPLLHMISSQIAARRMLAGAYVVMEQANESGYACTSRDTILALLILIDDLARGAAKTVYVNFAGNLGVVLKAAGANVWASGYYLSQRRLQLAHYDDQRSGPAYPRFYSRRLASDIGLEGDVPLVFRNGLAARALTRSTASQRVLDALNRGTYPASVPDWQYNPNNIRAAAAHYYEISQSLGSYIDSLDPTRRPDTIEQWLVDAVGLVEELERIGVSRTHSDLTHQRVWLEAFRLWRQHANV